MNSLGDVRTLQAFFHEGSGGDLFREIEHLQGNVKAREGGLFKTLASEKVSLAAVEIGENAVRAAVGVESLEKAHDPLGTACCEIVELIVETVCARRKTTRIAGADFPHEVVRSRFLKLDSSHIEFVMESLHNNTTEVRNMKQYLLTVLFNAPVTMSNHYTAQVNHDMYAGGW